MPTVYRRKPGSRRYKDYSDLQLLECLHAIRSKQLTQREAEARYRIPRSTIKNKLKSMRMNKPGRPTVFTHEEEESFVAHITALSEYGFPLCEFDLMMIVKDYLLSQGRQVPQFRNNVPGKEWVQNFLRRHRGLTRRFANNIKKVRAQVSEEVISNFIHVLTPELDVYNYDETNLCDDPGKKKIICRRGTKYPEQIINATKLSYSVMFCGNAAGEAVPPYVIYRSEHLWTTWTENGPDGAHYNRTKSGWIDGPTFEDWFKGLLLPILKKKTGRKIIIGDNLASHINSKVLEECEKNNIGFICLPPNATHILQPLDVAYFRPLKVKWRQVLRTWKETQLGRKLNTAPKEVFPGLLKRALDNLTDTKENLIAGFKKTGIVPPNKNEPLERLPKQDRILHLDLIHDSFLKKLESSRAGDSPDSTKVGKKKKLNVPAGKSITCADILEAGPSGEPQKKKQKKTRRLKGRKLVRLESTSTNCSDSHMSLASSTEDLIVSHLSESDDDRPLACFVAKTEKTDVHNAVDQSQFEVHQSQEERNKEVEAKNYKIGDYVIVRWDSSTYPGTIISVSEEGAIVNCMKKGKKFWRWPDRKDEELYRWDDILSHMSIPKLISKGCFQVPEIDNFS